MQRLLRHLLLLLCLLLSAYPLLWMTLASLRTDADVLEHPFAWPSSWQLRSYGDVLAAGGFGSAVNERLHAWGLKTDVLNLGVPDRFIEQGSVSQQMADCGLDVESVAAAVMERLNR